MQTPSQKRKTLIAASLICALTAFTPTIQSVIAQSQTPPVAQRSARAAQAFTELIDKAQSEGPVRVIVGLQHNTRASESATTEAQAMQLQHNAIERA